MSPQGRPSLSEIEVDATTDRLPHVRKRANIAAKLSAISVSVGPRARGFRALAVLFQQIIEGFNC
jgi:hypothetical protein